MRPHLRGHETGAMISLLRRRVGTQRSHLRVSGRVARSRTLMLTSPLQFEPMPAGWTVEQGLA